jgi:hypothetical protein
MTEKIEWIDGILRQTQDGVIIRPDDARPHYLDGAETDDEIITALQHHYRIPRIAAMKMAAAGNLLDAASPDERIDNLTERS